MNRAVRKVLKNQGYHLLIWIILGGLLYVETRRSGEGSGAKLLGWSTATWVLFSWVFAALHQGWVWLFWRMELYRKLISSRLGEAGFPIFRIGFLVLASVRLLALIPISVAAPYDAPVPRWLSLGFIVVTTPLILWALYCVVAYFGVTRLLGADHFDAAYRGGSLETRGIFKYIPNAMYTVLLLALYHPGFLLGSRLGLITALAHHLLVWTHYFCTERPDMREIYGNRSGG